MSFGLKITNGDIELSGGSISLLQNKDKLIQDVLKILFTSTGENKIHPWYGTPLLSRVVGQSTISDVIEKEVIDAISYGLGNLKTLQQLQEQDSQFVTPQEMLASVKKIEVKLNEQDKRKLVISIEIVARSNELITESFVVNV